MKKANKILMASVAILLSLVLITTSVVSGVFAKFAIKKNTTTTMKLEKFGVTMEVLDPTNYAKIDTSKTVNDGQNVSITFNDLIMQPNDYTTSGYLQIKFSGITTVITDLKVWVDIELSEKFYVPADVFPDYPTYAGKAHMPINIYPNSFKDGTKIGGSYPTPLWESGTGANAQEAVNDLEEKLERALASGLVTILNGSNYIASEGFDPDYPDPLVGPIAEGNGYYARKTFAAGQSILLQYKGDTLGFYFYYPYTNNNSGYKTEFAAYIADRFTENDVPIKMTIVVSLEQAK